MYCFDVRKGRFSFQILVRQCGGVHAIKHSHVRASIPWSGYQSVMYGEAARNVLRQLATRPILMTSPLAHVWAGDKDFVDKAPANCRRAQGTPAFFVPNSDTAARTGGSSSSEAPPSD
jgi:hypothetical protein